MNQNAGQGTGLRERDGINVIHTRMQVIIVAWQDAKTHFILSPFAWPRSLGPDRCSLFVCQARPC